MASSRIRTLTEKGIGLYEDVFEDYHRQVKRKKHILERYLDTQNLSSKSAPDLQEYKNSLVLAMSDYENSVKECTDFLARNRNEHSDRERSSMGLILSSAQGRYQVVLNDIDTLLAEIGSSSQKAPSIKSKISHRSNKTASTSHSRSTKSTLSLSVISIKHRAEMEAKRVKLKAAKKEADIIQKQAALQADLTILTAQREYEEAEVKHKVFMEELEDSDIVSSLSNDLDNQVPDRTSQYVEDQNNRLIDMPSNPLVANGSVQHVDHNVPLCTGINVSSQSLPSSLVTPGPLPSCSTVLTQAVTSATPYMVPTISTEIDTTLKRPPVNSDTGLQLLWSTLAPPIMSHTGLSASAHYGLSTSIMPIMSYTGMTSADHHGLSGPHQVPKEALPVTVVPTSTCPFSEPTGVFTAPVCTSTLNPHASVYVPTVSISSEAQTFTTFLLKKELLFSRLTKFSDTPGSYIIWKTSFRNIMRELAVTPMEEMDLLVKWLGPDSARQASSLRASNPMNPSKGVRLIWERLDQRYGSPEVIEDALKRKLTSFTKFTKNDTSRYYDLLDILSEVDANMQNSDFKDLLSYYNSSSGIIPIVNKLPQGVQEKWTTHAHKYKQEHHVPYPPFVYFMEFISDITRMKNDPGFSYEQSFVNVGSKPQQTTRNSQSSTSKVMASKTEVKDAESKQPSCPLHHTKHKLNKCREFRKMSIQDRKEFLRKNRICFKCCGQDSHNFKECKVAVICEICKSSQHPSALHIDKDPVEPPSVQGGENETIKSDPFVKSLCSQICKDSMGVSKSCGKTVLVKVYPTDHPEKALRLYAIIDDQSNQSLAKSAFFDLFRSDGNYVEYSLSSCSGTISTAGRKASGFTVESIDGRNSLLLPPLLECNKIPNARHEIPVPEVALYHPHLRELSDCIPPLDINADILLLIGRDLPAAHHVEDQKVGPLDGPIGQRLKLGWVIIGEVCLGHAHQPQVTVNKTYILPHGRPSGFLPCPNCFEVKPDKPSDFPIYSKTSQDDKPGLSIEDKEFLRIMKANLVKDCSGNWEAPLPFKLDRPKLPNNRSQAVRRALSLDASLRKDCKKQSHMMEFMDKIISNGHAEVAPKLHDGEECWYLPLFGVYHPKKPGKIRGVFDSSAKHNGISLNMVLLSGPNIVNNLLGILMRFREDSVAITADIEQMFYCFKVAEHHRNFLRFLWYQDNCLQSPLIEYRMTTHVFGNSPSPAVAMYGLRKAVEGASKDVRKFVNRDFYVDDGLTSTTSDEAAVSLVTRTQKTLMENGNIRLHKVVSNSQNVLKSLNQNDLASDLKDLDLQSEIPPVQRSLGLYWNLSGDFFTFVSDAQKKPYTRRGVLATINSLFDPLGFGSPVVLKGRLLFRELITSSSDWDEPLPEKLRAEWESWCESLHQLGACHIPRQYIPDTLYDNGQNEIHIYSDASKYAISAVAYLRKKIDYDQYDVSFLLGKVKLAPQHGHTIPRLELCAAVLATEIGRIINEQLDIPLDQMHFYTDSNIVLGYLWNRVRRFFVYVSNRVDRILHISVPEQWSHVPSNQNPADEGTRCIQAADLQTSLWLQGPSFLKREAVTSEPGSSEVYPLLEPDKDCEVRPNVNTVKTTTCINALRSKNFENFSTWKSLVRGVAKLTSMIKARRQREYKNILRPVTAEDLSDAKLLILKEVQQALFAKEIQCLKKSKSLPRDSSILSLSPFLDTHGLICVGGRLNRSGYSISEKHPIILTGKHRVALLLVRHYHLEVHHQGRHLTEGAIRQAGFWITGGKRLVSKVLQQCIHCRKLRGKFCHQKMSDLPSDRLKPCPPFTSVGVDVFGPWTVVSRRTRGGLSHSKRWAVLFTCLASRAVHIEVIDEMSTSTFINALRRFYSVRGPVKELRSDRGTNFVGCTSELGIHSINIEDLQMVDYLKNRQTVWIFNPPHASHMGGVWERQIGIARRILDSMLLDIRGKSLTHEVLTTLMCEVSAIINSRPLANVSTDPQEPSILSPSTLLTQKPASMWLTDFSHLTVKDMYRNQWKCVQVLAEEFWTKWKREYIMSLQQRRKWRARQPNLKEGDIVLLKDSSVSRMEWPIGIIIRVFSSDDGLVRTVEVKVFKGDQSSCYVRPVTEFVFLMSSD